MHRDAHADRHPCCRDLFKGLQVDLVRLPGAAVLLWVRQTQQAYLAQDRKSIAREPTSSLLRSGTRGQFSLSDLTHQSHEFCSLFGWQQPIDGHLAPFDLELLAQSRAESAYFVVARSGKSASAHSSSARRRAIFRRSQLTGTGNSTLVPPW